MSAPDQHKDLSEHFAGEGLRVAHQLMRGPWANVRERDRYRTWMRGVMMRVALDLRGPLDDISGALRAYENALEAQLSKPAAKIEIVVR